MSSGLRIILVDPRGEVLFSGESMTAKETVAPPEPLQPQPVGGIDDACPPTMRSPTSESGMFATFRIAQDEVDTVPENAGEIRSSRPRAA